MEGGKGSLLGWAELPVTEIENSEKVSYSFHFLWHYFLKWHCSVLTDWSRGRLWGWRGSWRSAVDPEQKFPLRLGFFISNHLASASWAQIRPSKYGYREGGCQQTVPKGDYSGTPKPQARPAKNRWYTLYLMIFSGTNTEFCIPDHWVQAAVMVKIRTFKLNPDLFRTAFWTFPDL